MPISHFHDGRILITTMSGMPNGAEVAAACAALRDHTRATAPPVLLDARECEGPDLPDWIGQMLDAGERTPRFAILVGSDRELAQGETFRMIAAEHGSEAQTFDTVGLALRWLWRLDDASATPAAPGPEDTIAGRPHAGGSQALEASTRSRPLSPS